MEIYRFDPEVSVPIGQFGSSFLIGPLSGPDARGRLQIMHLPAGGLIGPHPTGTPQLFAVVAGTGWVTGGSEERRAVSPGIAVVWNPGETHSAGSDEGLTAVCFEGTFEMWATRVTVDIQVVDYDPRWPSWFEELRDRIWPAVSEVAVRVDHVGSTAVPGLPAKPVIDMDIVVASDAGVTPGIDALRSIGYRWRGELGVAGRQAFAPPPGGTEPPHHLYLVVEDNKAHVDHWLLRDTLRTDSSLRAAYGALKRANAAAAGRDMDLYVAAKAAFVADLLTRARAERGLPAATYWEPGPPAAGR